MLAKVWVRSPKLGERLVVDPALKEYITHKLDHHQAFSYLGVDRFVQDARQAFPDESAQDLKKAFQVVKAQFAKGLQREGRKKKRAAMFRGGSQGPAVFNPEVERSVVADEFSEGRLQESLVEDTQKAQKYVAEFWALAKYLPTNPHVLDDSLSSVYARALAHRILDQSMPVLTHELGKSRFPYLTYQSALSRLLKLKAARNAFDESLVEDYTRQQVQPLIACAVPPPEAFEPIIAFRGDREWSYCPVKRMTQKLKGVSALVDHLVHQEPLKTVNPGFESEVPRDQLGGQFMGRPLPPRSLRYPTLGCVAHSLPTDPAYKSAVIHAIKLLEVSPKWPQASKIQMINSLKEVYDNLKPMAHYQEKLEAAMPLVRPARAPQNYKTSWRRTKPFIFYIRSLTTQKPMWSRPKRKDKK